MERKLFGEQLNPPLEISSRGFPQPPALRSTGLFYLLIFEGDSTRVVDLPDGGRIVIGTGPHADIRLLDNTVADDHAELAIQDGSVSLRPLAKTAETRINGEPVYQLQWLSSADILSVGSTSLVFHQRERTPENRPIAEFNRFQKQAEGEIERGLRYHRPLSLLALRISPPHAGAAHIGAKLECLLRVSDIAGWDGQERILVLLPETGREAAMAATDRLLRAVLPSAPNACAGVATLPFDGCDIDTLLSSARAASLIAVPGRCSIAADSCKRLSLKHHKLLIADPAMLKLYELVERIAASDLPIFVCGETGTGKELVASAIHAWSPRRERPFVALNCAALHDNLIESELFGHEKGSFTGAANSKIGLLELGDGGTVFLDEIGELSSSAQAKLLRVLETKRFTRLGDVREREINVRIVAATNRNLEDHVRSGAFREDLYYRLKGALLWIPPLRDRAREIPLLAASFLSDACTRRERAPMALSFGALHTLCQYSWPGNVRELRNLMEFMSAALIEDEVEDWHIKERIAPKAQRAAASSQRGLYSEQDASAAGSNRGHAAGEGIAAFASASKTPLCFEETTPAPVSDVHRRFRPIDEEIRELERARMTEALAAAGGNQTRAAELIAMPLRTFVAKMKQYDIPRRSEAFGKR